MNKNLLFILLIIVAALGATSLFQSSVVDSTSAQARNSTTTQASTATTQVPTENQTSLSQEKDGIEISIDAVEQRGNTTVLKLILNNHQFDLSKDEIYDNATLGGVPSQSHTFLGEPSGGGHHVEVEVVFPPTTEGLLQITPSEGTTFTFNALW